MSNGPRSSGTPRLALYLPVVVAALVVGAAIGSVALGGTGGPDGTVAVIPIDQTITSETTGQVVENLREARRNESIDAVVLRIDSPGGGAAASEALYLAVNKTAAEMPVVAAVQGLGASGAYYAMLPAETIYVTPSSLVGSVGVRAGLPSGIDAPGEITTGPDKNGGRTADEARAQVETLRRAFVNSVFEHRGDELSLTREQVSYAKVYTGASAVRNGMADETGGLGTAIDRAAELAGLESYDIARFESPRPPSPFLLSAGSGNETVVVQREAFGYEGVESPRFLMLYGAVEEQEVITDESG